MTTSYILLVQSTPRTNPCILLCIFHFPDLPQSSLLALPQSSLNPSHFLSHFEDVMFLPRKRRLSTQNELPPPSHPSMLPRSSPPPLTQLSPCAQKHSACVRGRVFTPRNSTSAFRSRQFTHLRFFNASRPSFSASFALSPHGASVSLSAPQLSFTAPFASLTSDSLLLPAL